MRRGGGVGEVVVEEGAVVAIRGRLRGIEGVWSSILEGREPYLNPSSRRRWARNHNGIKGHYMVHRCSGSMCRLSRKAL